MAWSKNVNKYWVSPPDNSGDGGTEEGVTVPDLSTDQTCTIWTRGNRSS